MRAPDEPPAASAAAAAAPTAAAEGASERQRLLQGQPGGSAGAEPQYQATSREEEVAQAAAGGVPDEQQRRGSLDERRQFQAARQDALRTAVFSSNLLTTPRGWLIAFLGLFVIVVPTLILFYIEFRSWYVLFTYGSKPCDQDLMMWLLLRNIMTVTTPRMPGPGEMDEERAERQRAAARWAASFCTMWLIVGYVWTAYSVTCVHTNPQLYHWVRFLTSFGLLLHCICIFFPVLFLLCAMAYHAMVARGWIKSPNAASDDAIERMEQVTYCAETFNGEGNHAAPSECCCCMEQFGAEKAIVCTPCTHYFHHDCLKEWLRLSKTCPLCRGNLDVVPPEPPV